MRSSELLPAPEISAGRLVLLPGAADAPAVDARYDGWTRVALEDVTSEGRPLLVVPVGASGSVLEVLPVLEELRPVAILVLADEPPNDPRIERAAVRLAAYGYRVERVADLEDGQLLAGVLLTAAEDADADDPAAASREARRRLEELRVSSTGAAVRSVEALQRRLRAAERARSREVGRAAQLEQDLRWATRELALERRRLTDVERSTSYRLGQTVVQGIKDPRTLGSSSRELLDRWRKRGSGDAVRAERERDASPPAGSEAPGVRAPIVTTVPLVGAPDRRTAVAGVVTDRTAAALEDEVLLTRLLPHDAVDLVAALGPPVVLIESEACGAGSPWYGAGSGAVPARDRDLAAVVDAADRAGAATVVVWSGPRWRAPGLGQVAARCTLEVAADERGFDWVLGVPPARIGVSTGPVDGALATFEAEPSGRRSGHRPGDVVRYGAEVGGPASTDPWSLWTRHAAWLVPVTGPERWQVTAAAVAGRAPVVTEAELPAWAADRGAVRPGSDAEHRPEPTWEQRSRAVLEGGTVPSLRTLGTLLGRDLVSGPSRSVALRLLVPDDRAVDTVLAQAHLPGGSVVVTPSPVPARAQAALEAVGVRVSGHVPADARFLVDLHTERHGTEHLAGLLAGWELTRAPVVARCGSTLRRGTVAEASAGDVLVDRDQLRTGPDGLVPDTPAVLVPATEGRP